MAILPNVKPVSECELSHAFGGLSADRTSIIGIPNYEITKAAPCGAACETQVRYLDGAMNWK